MFAAGALIGALCGSPALAFDEFASGVWRGGAFFRSARFTHCRMLANQGHGMLANRGSWKLLVTLDKQNRISLGLAQRELRFTKGEKIQGLLQIGDGPATTRTFTAAKASLAAIPINGEDVKRLQQAGRAKIRIGDFALDVELPGPDAFAKLSSCVAKRRGAS